MDHESKSLLTNVNRLEIITTLIPSFPLLTKGWKKKKKMCLYWKTKQGNQKILVQFDAYQCYVQ